MQEKTNHEEKDRFDRNPDPLKLCTSGQLEVFFGKSPSSSFACASVLIVWLLAEATEFLKLE